jgi:plastin-1
VIWNIYPHDDCSGLDTTTPGRVDKSAVLQAIQASGESYDQARETLKHVSVDASGKVELEDWVEVHLDAS